ncbi:hypothetical protein TrVE_jg3638 [Triparma verrucosa]|uniref:protein-tyrosine-phosphatase n=2 Tax=Triparma TaxID=722752 RepID=A0A9W7F1E1_9STRA|nr:hypothetical protein TrVE_jg3638 [Triparma verrucosa]GMH98012.1 hypothetical protein TrST_g1254 [Triparma strigata]
MTFRKGQSLTPTSASMKAKKLDSKRDYPGVGRGGRKTLIKSASTSKVNITGEMMVEDVDDSGMSEKERRKIEEKEREEKARAKARARWKKAGNLAIAAKRFERSGRERSEKKPGSRSNSPVPTPSNRNSNNGGGVNTGRAQKTGPSSNGGSVSTRQSATFVAGAKKKGQGSSKEIERCRKARAAIEGHPGPQVKNGRFTSRGVHAVRWKEKLRGLSLVTNNIVLGGRDEANNKGLMDKYGVTHILNVCKQLPNFFPTDYTYLKINAMDSPDYQLVQDYAKAAAFLSHVEKINGRCLVHCIAGVSRSVTLVMMHLMRNHEVCLNQCYKHIKSCRPFIRPNEGFLFQAAEFELQTFGFTSVASHKMHRDFMFYKWNKEKSKHPRGGDDGDLIGTSCCAIS